MVLWCSESCDTPVSKAPSVCMASCRMPARMRSGRLTWIVFAVSEPAPSGAIDAMIDIACYRSSIYARANSIARPLQ